MTATALHTLQLGKGWFPEETGGLDRYYYELLDHLSGSGVRVTGLVTGSAGVAADSRDRVHAFAPTRSGLATRWRGVRRDVRHALAHESVDVVATHFALYAAPCLDLLRDAPLVVHFQGPWAAECRVEGAFAFGVRLKARLEREVYGRASRCITLSTAFARILARDYQISDDRIVTVPGGIDVARWQHGPSRREAREMLGWPQDRPIVFAVRRLARRMGLEQLVASIPLLRRYVPDVLVQIAGKGPIASELERRRHEHGLADHLRLLGYLSDDLLPLAYRAADLTVVPSAALEGFGLVVVESFASGTPVLVSDVGGLPETIEALAPQCIVRQPGAGSWAAALADAVLGHIPLPDAPTMVAFARDRFDWSVVVPRLVDVYREAMQ